MHILIKSGNWNRWYFLLCNIIVWKEKLVRVIDICEKEGGNQGNQVIGTLVDTLVPVAVVQLGNDA